MAETISLMEKRQKLGDYCRQESFSKNGEPDERNLLVNERALRKKRKAIPHFKRRGVVQTQASKDGDRIYSGAVGIDTVYTSKEGIAKGLAGERVAKKVSKVDNSYETSPNSMCG